MAYERFAKKKKTNHKILILAYVLVLNIVEMPAYERFAKQCSIISEIERKL